MKCLWRRRQAKNLHWPYALSVVRFPSFVVRRRRRRFRPSTCQSDNPTAHLQPLVAVVGWIPRSLSLLSGIYSTHLRRRDAVSTYFCCRSNALRFATQHTHFIHRIFRKIPTPAIRRSILFLRLGILLQYLIYLPISEPKSNPNCILISTIASSIVQYIFQCIIDN